MRQLITRLSGHKSLLAHHTENTDEFESSPDEGGDAARTGDASRDDCPKLMAREWLAALLRGSLAELIAVGDTQGAQAVVALLCGLSLEQSLESESQDSEERLF